MVARGPYEGSPFVEAYFGARKTLLIPLKHSVIIQSVLLFCSGPAGACPIYQGILVFKVVDLAESFQMH